MPRHALPALGPNGVSEDDEPAGAGSVNSTKIAWVSVSPMFCADVLPRVLLGGQPSHLPDRQVDVHLPTVGDDSAAEGTQRVHDAVGMPVRAGRGAGPVPVLKHPNAVVFEHNPIQPWIEDALPCLVIRPRDDVARRSMIRIWCRVPGWYR